MKKINFISGLPRSGSTLLAGILRQNSRIAASMTSPVNGMIAAILNTFQPQVETSVFLDEEKRRRILMSIFDAYYTDAVTGGAEIIFDTNRNWSARLPLLKALFPEAKVVACVRDVPWILDSFECLVRRNAFEPSNLFVTPEQRATVFSRTETLAHKDRVVGAAYTALKEAYYGELSDMLLLVDYDLLTQKPGDCLNLIYQFLGVDPFAHDFDNVEYDEPEFDKKLGAPGLHTVKRKVEYRPRRTILPPEIFDKYKDLSFWTDPAGTKAFRITPIKKDA